MKPNPNYRGSVFYTEVNDLATPASAIPFDNESSQRNSINKRNKGKFEKIQSKDEHMIV